MSIPVHTTADRVLNFKILKESYISCYIFYLNPSTPHTCCIKIEFGFLLPFSASIIIYLYVVYTQDMLECWPQMGYIFSTKCQFMIHRARTISKRVLWLILLKTYRLFSSHSRQNLQLTHWDSNKKKYIVWSERLNWSYQYHDTTRISVLHFAACMLIEAVLSGTSWHVLCQLTEYANVPSQHYETKWIKTKGLRWQRLFSFTRT